MPEFNLLTMNLHMGFSSLNRRFVLPEMREAVRAVGAEVVCLQEVMGANERHARRHPDWPSVSQYEFLADQIWPQHAYGRNAVYPEGHHGNALLSTYEILRYDNRDISVFGHENRGMLHAVLRLPGAVDVHIVCTHLGLMESHRQRQLGLLCALLGREIPDDAPVVVAGDFNDWRLRGHPRLLECGMHEVFERAHGRLARTFPARYPALRLDRIYLRNARALEVEVLSTSPWPHLSDHLPLLVRVAV